ncbi:gp53-like domain-containing protein, partial [Pectobacterium versatile]|uniref:gp53-like domain-containing protein n=4 Tax=Pectobacterium TaxID=122277 RepID=UPI003CD0D93C
GDVGAYTKAETDTRVAAATTAANNAATAAANANTNANGRVPSSRTVNGKALSADIALGAGDVGALTDTQAAQKYALRSIKINGKPLSADVNLLAGDIDTWNKTESDGRYLGKAATAAAATKLATPRKINGVAFDGASDITLDSNALGFGESVLSDNGYQVLPSGLIIQWGVFYIEVNGLQVNFPRPFNNKVFTVIMGSGEDATVRAEVANIIPNSITKIGFKVNASETSRYSFVAYGI